MFDVFLYDWLNVYLEIKGFFLEILCYVINKKFELFVV